jgi:hypothetical protein
MGSMISARQWNQMMKSEMNDKQRLAGFKALLSSHQTNGYYLFEPDGMSLHLWQELSAEGKLEVIARDAAYYDVAFEPFAEAVRECVDAAVIEDAALRLAMRSSRELHDLEKLFPDDGRTEPPPSLVERVNELLNSHTDNDIEAGMTPQERDALFAELRADEAAAKHEDAHWYGNITLQEMRNEKAKAPAIEKVKDRDVER